MKRFKRSLLFGALLFFGLLIISSAIFYIRFQKATKTLVPSETGAINDSVFCIKDKYVNAFLFKGDSGYLMVDAGFTKKGFSRGLETLGISPDQVHTILLTHTDADHIGGMSLFENVVVYMHKDEEQMVNGTTGKMKYFKTKWKYGPYTLLENNDTLTIDGIKIKIIHTPGHTPGSSCYIIGSDYLLTGDNLIVNNNEYEKFVEMFNMDTPRQMESIKVLPDPDVFKYILTGHHGVIRVND